MEQLRWAHVFIDVPASSTAATLAFWSRVLGWPAGDPWADHPEFVSLVPPSGSEYVHVQQVDRAARVHLDLVVDDLDAARERAVELGATAGARRPRWQVMTSPGGLPFCLCLAPATGRRPEPIRWSGGHRSRLTHLCIDIPAVAHPREVDFWQQLTGWRHAEARFGEFSWLVGPAGASINLLLQRLGADDPATSTRAHIDLGTDDVDAEAGRVVAGGATYVEKRRDWVVLQDPSGQLFCVTPQPPG